MSASRCCTLLSSGMPDAARRRPGVAPPLRDASRVEARLAREEDRREDRRPLVSGLRAPRLLQAGGEGASASGSCAPGCPSSATPRSPSSLGLRLRCTGRAGLQACAGVAPCRYLAARLVKVPASSSTLPPLLPAGASVADPGSVPVRPPGAASLPCSVAPASCGARLSSVATGGALGRGSGRSAPSAPALALPFANAVDSAHSAPASSSAACFFPKLLSRTRKPPSAGRLLGSVSATATVSLAGSSSASSAAAVFPPRRMKLRPPQIPTADFPVDSTRGGSSAQSTSPLLSLQSPSASCRSSSPPRLEEPPSVAVPEPPEPSAPGTGS
mmetsp:Transcript_30151/g.77407  ORF Transcript_30151/g.77407 Transcript_30151/m.77407 type:complete len:329 (-) Transcript_30151:417-1403(-)